MPSAPFGKGAFCFGRNFATLLQSPLPEASLAKGAECAGGTRLPLTEPTGEIGTAFGGGGISLTFPLHLKAHLAKGGCHGETVTGGFIIDFTNYTQKTVDKLKK